MVVHSLTNKKGALTTVCKFIPRGDCFASLLRIGFWMMLINSKKGCDGIRNIIKNKRGTGRDFELKSALFCKQSHSISVRIAAQKIKEIFSRYIWKGNCFAFLFGDADGFEIRNHAFISNAQLIQIAPNTFGNRMFGFKCRLRFFEKLNVLTGDREIALPDIAIGKNKPNEIGRCIAPGFENLFVDKVLPKSWFRPPATLEFQVHCHGVDMPGASLKNAGDAHRTQFAIVILETIAFIISPLSGFHVYS